MAELGVCNKNVLWLVSAQLCWLLNILRIVTPTSQSGWNDEAGKLESWSTPQLSARFLYLPLGPTRYETLPGAFTPVWIFVLQVDHFICFIMIFIYFRNRHFFTAVHFLSLCFPVWCISSLIVVEHFRCLLTVPNMLDKIYCSAFGLYLTDPTNSNNPKLFCPVAFSMGNASWVLQFRSARKFVLGCLPTSTGIFQKEPQVSTWRPAGPLQATLAFITHSAFSLGGKVTEPTSLKVQSLPYAWRLTSDVSWVY